MTISQMRRELKKRIDHLNAPRLRSAADFVGYLEESSSPIAVTMSQRIANAEREVARGDVTSVRHLRRKRLADLPAIFGFARKTNRVVY